MPPDDLVLLGAADPPVADEPWLGFVVEVVPLPVLGEDAAAAGCALDCDVLAFGALWQPASAKRTAEAKINFFIICSPISIGGWRSICSSPTLYPMSSPLGQVSSSKALPHRLTRVLGSHEGRSIKAPQARPSCLSDSGHAGMEAQRVAAAPVRVARGAETTGPRHDMSDYGRHKGIRRNPPRRSRRNSPT